MANETQDRDSREGGQNDPNRNPKAPDPSFANQTRSTPGESKPSKPADLKKKVQ